MEPEIVRTVEGFVEGPHGREYAARICGRPTAAGRWEGWIEFISRQGGPVLRSRRETTQPNRRNLQGWADRLGAVYLEGALERTLKLQGPRPVPAREGLEHPRFQGPAPEPGPGRPVAPDDSAVNPFLRYRRGEDTLRRELEELAPAELRTVVRAYDLADDPALDVEALTGDELVTLIVRRVRERMLR